MLLIQEPPLFRSFAIDTNYFLLLIERLPKAE